MSNPPPDGAAAPELVKKRSPNRLMVDEADKDDNSIICMSQSKFEQLQLFKGDAVTIRV